MPCFTNCRNIPTILFIYGREVSKCHVLQIVGIYLQFYSFMDHKYHKNHTLFERRAKTIGPK